MLAFFMKFFDPRDRIRTFFLENLLIEPVFGINSNFKLNISVDDPSRDIDLSTTLR